MSAHKRISLIKSGIRLIAIGLLIFAFPNNSFAISGSCFLGAAEGIGILEEEFE